MPTTKQSNISSYIYMYLLMSDAEGRKQASKVIQTTQQSSISSYTCHMMCTCIYMYMLMRDAEGRKEGRKKQARSYKQQGKATQHTQGSHFSKEK